MSTESTESTESRTTELVTMIEMVYQVKNTRLYPAVLDVWVKILIEYELAKVREALGRYIRTKTFNPDIADVLELMGEAPKPQNSAWPPPEEAWNLVPKTEDEGGWLNEENAIALRACQDSLNHGDHFGARRAFLERYALELRGKTGEPTWWLSEPTHMDPEARAHWKATMLLEHPRRRPLLLDDSKKQIEDQSAPVKRSAGGLQKIG